MRAFYGICAWKDRCYWGLWASVKYSYITKTRRPQSEAKLTSFPGKKNLFLFRRKWIVHSKPKRNRKATMTYLDEHLRKMAYTLLFIKGWHFTLFDLDSRRQSPNRWQDNIKSPEKACSTKHYSSHSSLCSTLFTFHKICNQIDTSRTKRQSTSLSNGTFWNRPNGKTA